MKKIILGLIILITLLHVDLYAETTIRGIVVDSLTGSALPGATVMLQSGTAGTITDNKGKFALQISGGQATILIRYIGYVDRQLKITDKGESNNYFIELAPRNVMGKNVVVTASKRVQAVQDVPISFSVVNYRDLIDRNINTIDDALDYVPGVFINNDQVSIRGSSGFAYGVGSRVAMLVDGFPMLSGDQGDMKFDVVPVFNIEKIEIIKGAGSALYGTGALGGVINIITSKPGPEMKLRAKLFSGAYSLPKYEQWQYRDDNPLNSGLALSYSQSFGKFGMLLSGTYSDDQSYRQYDKSKRLNLFAKLCYDFSERDELSLTTSYARSNSDDWVYWRNLDSAFIPPSDIDQSIYTISQKTSAVARYKHIMNAKMFYVARSGVYLTDFTNNHDSDSPEYRASQALSLNSEFQFNIDFGQLFLTTGLNHVFNDVQSKMYSNNNQNIIALYSQAEYEILSDLTATAGARLDYQKISNEDDDNLQLSPKVAINYQAPFGTHFRASAGRGFRAATVAEKYATVSYSGLVISANPELKAETSVSMEIGATHEFITSILPFELDVCLYRNELDNMIEPAFETGGSKKVKFLNITRARINGLEIALRGIIGGIVALETNINYMDPMDIDSNETLKYRPRIIWMNRISIPYGMFELQADYRYISRIEKVDDKLRNVINDYDARGLSQILDMRLITDLSEIIGHPLKLSLNCKNLLNYYYIEMIGNMAPTRYIGLQVEAGL